MNRKTEGTPERTDAEVDGGPVRYLALGDSYTIGEAVHPTERWPNQLVETVRADGIALADPEIIATTGWTTADLWNAVEQTGPQGPFGLVSLLIGVNNQYQGSSLQEYEREFTLLLHAALDLSGEPGRTLVVSIPDWGVMPHAEGRDRSEIARSIDAFNSVARDRSLSRGARWVDITDLSRLAAIRPSLVASDGLHPSGAMYSLWTQRIHPVVLAALT